MMPDPNQLAAQGKLAFENKQFAAAAELFRRAADEFTAARQELMAAEMMNNLSVAYLQAGQAAEALTAALGTDRIFEQAKDLKRQGMALGNQAAALEGLGRNDEAIAAYERSAELFARAGEGDLQAMVMKSAAAIKLKTGRLTDSAFKMIGSLDVKDNPGFLERILKFLLRFIK
jgi:tetratricopeptide (TPR) repeat protein